MMKHGKKSVSQRIFNDAMQIVKTRELARIRAAGGSGVATVVHDQQLVVKPVEIFVEAIESLKPIIGLQGVKRGKTKYQVPSALSPGRRQQLAIKWLIQV